MSHILKSGSSLFTTSGSIIRIKDTINVLREPLNINLNYPQFIEYDNATHRYYIANSNTIKVYNEAFNLLATINGIAGIVSLQLDAINNRLIATDRSTSTFYAIDTTTYSITNIFSASGLTESVRTGYYDSQTNRFFIGTNKIYIYSNTGILLGMITDSRIQASNVINLFVNPYTNFLLISIPGKILLADTTSMLVQANAITGSGVTTPAFIRLDPINPNSYWLCNTAETYLTEMSVATNTAIRIVRLGESTPYSIWVNNQIGLYSILVADTGYNQFYKLSEKLV